MKVYKTENVRNLALVGHSGSGKTNLTESMLFQSGATKRLGNVTDKNTLSDFSKEEMERGTSIGTSIIPVEWRNFKVNIIDTPGYMDFSGEVIGALRASEAALLVIDATSGIEVGTERAWKYAENIGLPRIIFINKIDGENVNFRKLMEELEESFGKKVIPFSVPIGEGENFVGVTDVIYQKGFKYENAAPKETELNHDQVKATERMYEEIAEVVAGSDEVLMEKYFNGEKFTREDLLRGVTTALLEGDAVPLLVGSGEKGIGIDILLNTIVNYMPAPNDKRAHTGFRYEEGEEREISEKDPFAAVVFKTITDPFVGKISIFKVISGKLKKDTPLYNSSKEEAEKLGGVYVIRGKNQMEVEEICAGDIGATTKLAVTGTGDTLCTKDHIVKYKRIKYPQPVLFYAIEAKTKGDEEKLSTSLRKLREEDPSFVIERNAETKQLTIGGLGQVQLDVILEKLKNMFGVEVVKVPFIIPYRETIKKTASVQGKHKKQSGGAGQYGDVWVRFEPCQEDFVFDEEVFGGSVPKNYFPAVEKGIIEAKEHGVLAGYPVTNFKAVLYDGSYHDVDSNEMSFKIAASIAFKKGMEEANPVLLEPIMKVEVSIPDSYLGDVMGDMNKRRGRILGMDQQRDGSQLLIAEAPQSEMFEYSIDLRAMTQGRGNFNMEFVRYEEVPANISQKVIEKAKADKEKE
ncbi:MULTISPECIES: elongation factor G [Peptoniphilus]|uniref:Elongation factor G n=1 Tax=Peptoniphilus lacrimalis 315-B TaxID=596330 RepID=D1VU75_9FIRM|nr:MULTISPECIES: elongation factor G [Peptoniphilus]EFA89866.1 translation elongation factor G [Peptoniphilus lacrimalis 315-B]EFK39615.1 translation elongation factor G [Peptoniphilus sp. oral taxon 836 str. F0141]MDK8281496.1 elongation factor G [Peptoniphilus lacrimalis]